MNPTDYIARSKKHPLIYTAGPYTAPHAWQLRCNIHRAESYAFELSVMGYAVHCPHANTASFDRTLTKEHWLETSITHLLTCDVIFMLPSWETSAGATLEHDVALVAEKPVLFTLRAAAEFIENWNI